MYFMSIKTLAQLCISHSKLVMRPTNIYCQVPSALKLLYKIKEYYSSSQAFYSSLVASMYFVSQIQNINLPINRPKVTEYSGYYLDKIYQNFTSLNSLSSSPTADISPEAISKIYTQSANSYWTVNKHILQIFNTLAIPYLPYISNCKGQSNKMYLSQLM